MTEINPEIDWNDRLEQFFAGTGEKAHALSWIHKRCEIKYNNLRNYTDLPVIVLGVLNGATSIGSQSLFNDSKMASVGVGLIALTTAIMSTISSYFGWAKRAEAHRISSLQYAKFYRFLNVQMSLPRADRMSPAELLKYTKDHYDRMADTSPALDIKVIAEFQKKFDKPEYANLSKPEEANGLEQIEIYVESRRNTIVDASDSPRECSGSVGIAQRYESFFRGTGGFNRPTIGGTSRSLQERRGSMEGQPIQRPPQTGLQQESKHDEVSTFSTVREGTVGDGESL